MCDVDSEVVWGKRDLLAVGDEDGRKWPPGLNKSGWKWSGGEPDLRNDLARYASKDLEPMYKK